MTLTEFHDNFDVVNTPDNRHGARQLALQALYWEACDAGEAVSALENLQETVRLSAAARSFAEELVQLVTGHAPELEALIGANATHWRTERMARIDLIILRQTLAEILFIDEIPVRVSIDEAVELARIFSTEQSYAFVNGILDAVVHKKGLPV
jgi:N utilization substance protein B